MGLRGNTDTLSGNDWLRNLQTWGWSGTLALSDEAGSAFILLKDGQIQTSRGTDPSITTRNYVDFYFHSHPVTDSPELPSRFSRSVVPALRAVPNIGTTRALPRKLELKVLLDALRDEAFTGYLSLEKQVERGVLLLCDGKVIAAFYENDGFVREAGDALRLMRRAFVFSSGEVEYATLDEPLVICLLGLALGPISKGVAGSSGLESSELGYTYIIDGEAILRVAVDLHGHVGFYQALEPISELHLPDEPLGWEQQRYQLTLRGKDALNPMTELAMSFDSQYGRHSRKVLEHIVQGLNPEKVSDYLGLGLSELKPLLERLEGAGLIRQIH
jgi:hypothetical protein